MTTKKVKSDIYVCVQTFKAARAGGLATFSTNLAPIQNGQVVNSMDEAQMLRWLDGRRMPRPASRRGRRHLAAPTNEDDFVKQLRKLPAGDLLKEAVICFRLQEPFIFPRGGWGPGVISRLMKLYKEVSIMPEPFLQRTGVRRMKIYFRGVYVRTMKSTRLR